MHNMDTGNMVIGNPYFEEVIKSDYFVDKTGFLEKYIKEGPATLLITAPPRFGKSLMVDTSCCFFGHETDKNGEILPETERKNKELFKGTAISKCEGIMKEHFGRYAILKLDFSFLKPTKNFEIFLEKFAEFIKETLANHMYILKMTALSKFHKEAIDDLFVKSTVEGHLCKKLRTLSNLIYNYYNKKIFVLIDEFDAIFHNILDQSMTYEDEVLKKIVNFVQGAVGQLVKGNQCVKGSLIFASHFIASVLSPDCNNIIHHPFQISSRYSKFFGFTQEEIEKLIDPTCDGNALILQNLESWYNGYECKSFEEGTMKNYRLYCPWSVLNYLDTKQFGVHWGANRLCKIGKILSREAVKDILARKILGIKEDREKDEDHSIAITYNAQYDIDLFLSLRHSLSEREETPVTNLWIQYIFELGYLSCSEKHHDNIRLTIPNKEVREIFEREVYMKEIFSNVDKSVSENERLYADAVKEVFRNYGDESVEKMAYAMWILLESQPITIKYEPEMQCCLKLALQRNGIDAETYEKVSDKNLKEIDMVIVHNGKVMIIEFKCIRRNSRYAFRQIKKKRYYKYSKVQGKYKEYIFQGVYFNQSGFEGVASVLHLSLDDPKLFASTNLTHASEVEVKFYLNKDTKKWERKKL